MEVMLLRAQGKKLLCGSLMGQFTGVAAFTHGSMSELRCIKLKVPAQDSFDGLIALVNYLKF